LLENRYLHWLLEKPTSLRTRDGGEVARKKDAKAGTSVLRLGMLLWRCAFFDLRVSSSDQEYVFTDHLSLIEAPQ
jgi:hypothetical protein